MRWRRPSKDRDRPVPADRPEQADRPVDDRTWSAGARISPGHTGTEVVADTALPAETGPLWAPDELSVWPVEGGRYGLDAHYFGATGMRRAQHQQRRLEGVDLAAGVRSNDRGGSTLRLGPLQHHAAWLALEAFLGRPIPTRHAEPAPESDAPRLDAET